MTEDVGFSRLRSKTRMVQILTDNRTIPLHYVCKDLSSTLQKQVNRLWPLLVQIVASVRVQEQTEETFKGRRSILETETTGRLG